MVPQFLEGEAGINNTIAFLFLEGGGVGVLYLHFADGITF